MSQDLLRHIESICRDKNIDRDSFVADLEAAMTSALRKAYVTAEAAEVKLDLLSGAISATVDNHPIDMHTLGRIAAQTAKQVIIQKTRERERTSIFEEYTEKRGTIITGTVSRVEGGNIIVQLVRGEGFLPRSEQIPGETHQPGERIRVLILEVREQPNQVKIILSRSHPEFVARLFELEVPEVAERIIEIKALAREAGYRSKVAVSSIDSKVDAVGACVGVRGSRIKNIVEELNNEKIDIVRWNESSQILIQNALKPAEVTEIALCFELGKATVVVAEDQLSLAIGKRGQNVRLASRLTGWDVDILTPTEYNRHLEALERTIKSIVGDDDILMDKFVAMGCVSVADVDEIGPDSFVKELSIDQPTAERIVEACGEEAIRQEEEREKLEREKAAMRAALAASGGVATPSAAAPSGFTALEGLPADQAGAEATGDSAAGSTGESGTEATDAGTDDTSASVAQSTDAEGSTAAADGALVENADPGDDARNEPPPSEPERRSGE